MSRTLIDLLAMDSSAQAHGCALHPSLRDAIEADLRFPSQAASPLPSEQTMQSLADAGQEGVVHLATRRITAEDRSRA